MSSRRRRSPHIGRLAKLLGEEGDAEPVDLGGGRDDPKPKPPRWIWPAAAAATLFIAVGAGLALWPGQAPSPPADPNIGPALLTKPVLPENPEIAAREQVATAESSNDTPTTAGGGYAFKLEPDEPAEGRGDFATSDPDFRACEKLPGKDGIAACDRAIASGKFTGRALSYLYSDRGFLLMHKGAIDAALTDLNKAAEIDPTNFYAYWNRGAVYAVKGDDLSARANYAQALALNPDQASKARIEEALNAVGPSEANAAPSDKSVITDPSRFDDQWESGASAAQSFPTDAMPASPPYAVEAPSSDMTTPMPSIDAVR
jgi:tetratricopeptide (TPR) repeat protein